MGVGCAGHVGRDVQGPELSGLLLGVRQRMEPTGAGEFVRLRRVAQLCSIHGSYGASIVDLGGGEGNLSSLLRPDLRANYVVLDHQAHGRGTRVIADLGSLPIRDGSVDLLCLSDVLEHVQDDRAFLEHVVRAVRPGGTAIIHVPSSRRSPLSAVRRELEVAERQDLQEFPHVRDGYEADDLVRLLLESAPGSTGVSYPTFTSTQSLLADLDWLLWRKRWQWLRVVIWALVRLVHHDSAMPTSTASSGLAVVVKVA